MTEPPGFSVALKTTRIFLDDILCSACYKCEFRMSRITSVEYICVIFLIEILDLELDKMIS
jgi:hypothetical protein